MGWSCSSAAHDVLEKWREACNKATGRGMFPVGKDLCFYEISHKEHEDGAVTGTIHKVVSGSEQPDGSGQCFRYGSFRIESDGTVTRAPAFLKKAAK